jgi:membrane peptidoglycan carboxypeptidase
MQERNQIALKAAKEQIPLTRRRFVRYASLLAGAIAGGGLATIAERIAVSTPAGLYGRMFELIGADNEQVQKEIDDKAETLMSTIYERFQRYTAEKSGQASGGRIFSRDGELLQNIDEENYIHIEDVPPQLISAVTLLEDKRIRDYITESGVDPSAFSSAVAQTLIGDESRGGSGLLQQVIKNSLYSPEEIMHERDQTHKSAEIPLATMAAQYIRELMLEEFGDISEEALSREMTKFIQEMYFNSVPWGPNRGFTQAIKYFWDVDNPQDLNDLQCWVMATRPNRPSELTLHDPEEDYRKWADFAQDTVREIIREDINNRKVSPLIDDVIKDAVAVDLRHIPLGKANLDSSSTITNHNDGSDAATPYLNYLKFTLGSDNLGQVVRRNLDIVGTLDWELQQDLHRLVAEHQETLPDSAEIDVVVTNAEGEILAIAGDPIQEQPIGSVIKPMIFSDALDRGLITQNDEFPDTPLYIETTPEGNWTVKNHNNTNYGDKFGIGPSIATSLNTTTAQVGIRLGPSGIKDAYRRFGLYPDDQAYGLPDCLGVSTSNPLLIAQAYRCLANSGRINRSCPVKKIHGPDGSQIYAASPMTQPAVSATAADFIVKELYTDSNFMGGGWEVLQGGTENGVYFFSKTGTPDSQKAVYTAGGTLPYASDTLIDATPLTVVVRVRFPDPDDRLAENPTGVSHAAPLYRRIIEAFCNYKTPEAFSPTPRTPDSTIVAGINRDYDITEQVTNPEETYYSRTNNYALEKTKSPLQEHMAKNNPYKMVTLHWTATDSAEKSLQHLSNPNAERLGKAHYVIDKAGKIFRIINPREFCPVHVDETDPDLNLHSISIEIVGTFIDEDGDNIPSSDDDNTINQKQISSASELIKGLIANGVLSSEAEILGHLHAKESTNQDPSQEIVNSVGEKVKSYYEKITIAQRQRQ